MSRTLVLALLALTLAPLAGFSQENAGRRSPGVGEYSVQVETTGGQAVSGILCIEWVSVECDFGLYHVKPAKIKVIRFSNAGKHRLALDPGVPPDAQGTAHTGAVAGVVSTTVGNELTGKVEVDNWVVRTALGEVVLNPAKLKSVIFTSKVEPPAEEKPALPKSDRPKGR